MVIQWLKMGLWRVWQKVESSFNGYSVVEGVRLGGGFLMDEWFFGCHSMLEDGVV